MRTRSSATATIALALSVLAGAACSGAGSSSSGRNAGQTGSPVPPTITRLPPALAAGHPHLWLTQSDLSKYQAWASVSNPLWQQGLVPLLVSARQDMDSHKVPEKDCGDQYTDYAVEKYAELFAFDGLVDPDLGSRADSMERARRLLMTVIDEAVKGPTPSAKVKCNGNSVAPRYRDPGFMNSDNDRARYHGEAFPLVVDWIYPLLSNTDKDKIRTVFLGWSDAIVHHGYNAPQPVGAHLEPKLTDNRAQVRFGGNNYFTAHMRNLGMMAMALDATDDPDGRLRAYLTDATETWLYIFDNLTRTDARGGALPEGFEYSPQTASYAVQLLLALHTAGEDDPSRYGPAVALRNDPFWDDLVANYAHSLSPATTTLPDNPDLGPVYQPAGYGDMEKYWNPGDWISVFGALGLLDRDIGATTKVDALRWLAVNTAPGGAKTLLNRVATADEYRDAVLYFLLLDPGATASVDPRPGYGLSHLASGLGELLARTGWNDRASWFYFQLPWNSVDHQHGKGLDFGLYRHGRWLTKQRAGYSNTGTSLIDTSEFANTLTVQHGASPHEDKSDYRYTAWQHGSQWINATASGDPSLLAADMQPDFVYALGEATNLYNAASEGVTGVQGVSRSIVWLSPDRVILYDRVDTDAKGFKRWWLQVPAPAATTGHRGMVSTSDGQQLVVTALLPDGANLQAINGVDKLTAEETATDEPMKDRILVSAPGDPGSVRFLNVLQGADQGAPVDNPVLLTSDDQAWQGVVAGPTAVLFPSRIGQPGSFRILIPADATQLLVTGLGANQTYTVTVPFSNGGELVTVQPGAGQRADSGGVLRIALSR